jgi:uncharacterized protein YdaT
MAHYQTATVKAETLQPIIMIVCEDSNSNYKYLNSRAAKDKIFIRIAFYNSTHAGGAQANKLAKFTLDEISKQNNEGNMITEAYCVLDVDDNMIMPVKSLTKHLTKMYEDFDEANKNNPSVKHQLIVSNECFEIWYILHFMDITEKLYRKNSAEKSNIKPDKSNSIEDLVKRLTFINSKKQKNTDEFYEIMETKGDENAAIERAKVLQAQSKGSRPFDNPSTEFYVLIERLNELKYKA